MTIIVLCVIVKPPVLWLMFDFLPAVAGVVGSGRFAVRPVKVSGLGFMPALPASGPAGRPR